jgi:hypothetical protein
LFLRHPGSLCDDCLDRASRGCRPHEGNLRRTDGNLVVGKEKKREGARLILPGGDDTLGLS